MGLLFIAGGIANATMARLGWMDEGGLMRRLDWWGVYKLMDHKYVGGGARRASYLISGALIFGGVVMAVGDFLRSR